MKVVSALLIRVYYRDRLGKSYPSQTFQSSNASSTCALTRSCTTSPPSCFSRSRRTVFSSAVNIVAFSGHGAMTKNETTATTHVIKPSQIWPCGSSQQILNHNRRPSGIRTNIQLHALKPPAPSAIASKVANKPLNAPARMAAEKKTVYLRRNSSFL